MKKILFSKGVPFGLVAGTALLLYVLSQLLLSRYHYQSGVDLLKQVNLADAEVALDRSLAMLPGGEHTSIFTTDLQRIATARGELFFRQADESVKVDVYATLLHKADEQYQLATKLNPVDITAAMGLARTLAALQQLHAAEQPKTDTPNDAQKAFEHALTLRPRGIGLHFYYIEYLALEQQHEKLHQMVTRLSAIYPPSYSHLKKATFYSPALRDALKIGLNQAIESQTFLRQAYSALSAIAMEEENLVGAINHYQASLAAWPEKNSAWNHIHMGRLQLKAGKEEQAAQQFYKALALSDERESTLRGIYGGYSQEKQYQAFLHFAKTAREKLYLPALLDISVARALMELGQLEIAKARLQRIDSGKHQAESFYYLARIAELQKDWDEMELAIQRATVLAPQNGHYHMIFSHALHRQKKYPQAEAAATRAIQGTTKPSQWWFHHRGWVRYNRKDYSGAIRDWKQAITLEPKRAGFYHQVALGYRAKKNYPPAIRYAQKSTSLDPQNKNYLKLLTSLRQAAGIKRM